MRSFYMTSFLTDAVNYEKFRTFGLQVSVLNCVARFLASSNKKQGCTEAIPFSILRLSIVRARFFFFLTNEERKID